MKIAGLDLVAVKVADVVPNPWNPNKQSDEMFEREKLSIQNNDFIDPITVREMEEGGYQIIDGEHRWRAATELGIEEVPASNLGKIPDHKAKKLTLLFNELKGDPEPALLARLMHDLADKQSIEDLALELPFFPAEIDALVKSADFDFDTVFGDVDQENQDAKSKRGKGGEEGKGGEGAASSAPPKTGAEMRRFVLSTVNGNIPVKLAEALVAEYKRSSDSVESTNVEIVLGDVLKRLRASAPGKRTTRKKKPNGPSGNDKGTGDRKASGNRRGAQAPQA